MKKDFKNLFVVFLLFLFVMIFKYNYIVKASIINASFLWFNNILPFLLPLYIVIDLLINYGITKLFKKKYFLLFFLSMVLGAPSNAKYIKEFYENKQINKSTADWLLLFCYSPNPLFILGICPDLKLGICVLFYNIIINILIAIFSYKKFDVYSFDNDAIKPKSFSKCLEYSIFKSFKILFMILGIVCIYSILNEFLFIAIKQNSFFLSSILELTNALNILIKSGMSTFAYMAFAVSFAGLSIHTQIKSILEDTDISYKYFFIGRCLASLIPLFFIILD